LALKTEGYSDIIVKSIYKKRRMPIMKKLLLCLCLLCFLCAFTYAKKMTILSFNKGEMTDDNNLTEVSLSEENAEKAGDFTLKVDFQAKTPDKTPWIASFKPKKAAWSGFTKTKFIVFNPSDKPVKIGWMIKGAKQTNGPENRKDWEVTLPPGKSEQEVKIVGVNCNDGKSPLDISQIYIWAFWNLEEKPVTIFLGKLWLEDDEK
jgi:hypothetical protein